MYRLLASFILQENTKEFMTDRTLIVFPSDDEHKKLKQKAIDCDMTLSNLLCIGAAVYKPKRGEKKGMEMFLEINDPPHDAFSLKQWDRYMKKPDNIQKVKKLVLALDRKLQNKL